jgi:hypothetical protein
MWEMLKKSVFIGMPTALCEVTSLTIKDLHSVLWPQTRPVYWISARSAAKRAENYHLDNFRQLFVSFGRIMSGK